MKIWFQNRRSKYKKVLKQGGSNSTGSLPPLENANDLESLDGDDSRSVSDDEVPQDEENNQHPTSKVKEEHLGHVSTSLSTPLAQSQIEPMTTSNMLGPPIIASQSTMPMAQNMNNNGHHQNSTSMISHVPVTYSHEPQPMYSLPAYNGMLSHGQTYGQPYGSWSGYHSSPPNGHTHV